MSDSSQLPAAPPQTPGFPSNPQPLVFEGFSGLNTKPVRNDIKDDECYILDGFMPLGASNIRVLPDIGTALYTASGKTIVSYYFANISTTPICVALLSDGSIIQINTTTAAVTPILAPGAITNPSLGFGLTQASGNMFIIIVAPQPNGYWVWNGTIVAEAGTLSLSVTVTNNGTGYTSVPTVTITGGSGSGAAFTASVTNSGVISVAVTNPGSGWLAGEAVTLGFTGGGGTSAAATMTIMPFGIQGTVIETFVSRAWVGNGPVISFTAPESVTDFATSDGAGTITSQDSFLRVGFYGLKQANGFLYTLGDSSINTISGVSTNTATPPVTTFSNQNVDPQIGTPWKDTVQVFSRNIVFANSFGIHVSYGGAVTRISAPLDGIYTSVPDIGAFQPSSAICEIFGIQAYALLYPIIDQYTGEKVNKLLMWDGKRWWTSSQSVALTYIASQEINSVLTAWGTDGTSIYPLFQNPSVNFTKIAQSRLWATPGYFFSKTSSRVFALFYFTELNGLTTIYIDKEFGTSQAIPVTPTNVIIWENNLNQVVTWANSLSQAVTFAASGYGIFFSKCSQWGTLLGLTVVTTDADMTVSSLTLFSEVWQSNL